MFQSTELIKTATMYMGFIQAGFVLLIGYFFARLIARLVGKGLSRLTYLKQRKLIERVFFYGILSLFFISALSQLGINLEIILGAAGILSIAIGFAAQTSASNFISGLFLIFERVISEGDVIMVDGVLGEVIAIDLLSTNLKTADNVLIRIPNETLIKSKLENLSRFTTRQLEIPIMFPYEQNMDQIKSLWNTLVTANSDCMIDPPPGFNIKSIEKDHVSVVCTVWVKRENYLFLKNELQTQLLNIFEQQKIRPATSLTFNLKNEGFTQSISSGDKA